MTTTTSVVPPEPLPPSKLQWLNVVCEQSSDKEWLYKILYEASLDNRFNLKADPYLQNGKVSQVVT